MNKAFTIVELLIVIVVIGVLSLLTVVTFNGLQDRARDSAAHTTASQVQRKIELRNATYGSYTCSTCTTAPQVIDAYDLASLATGGVEVYTLYDTWSDEFEFNKEAVAVIYQPYANGTNVRWLSVAYWNNTKKRWITTNYRDSVPTEILEDSDWPDVPSYYQNVDL